MEKRRLVVVRLPARGGQSRGSRRRVGGGPGGWGQGLGLPPTGGIGLKQGMK